MESMALIVKSLPKGQSSHLIAKQVLQYISLVELNTDHSSFQVSRCGASYNFDGYQLCRMPTRVHQGGLQRMQNKTVEPKTPATGL
jgi:hypothetical protein